MLVASLDLQEMTIGYTCEETDVAGFNHASTIERELWERLVERLDQFVSFLGRDISG